VKCSKKESKEYSQELVTPLHPKSYLLTSPSSYVERLLEQNNKYKTAMRILYANRRLSIQPDNIVIPSTESDDVPLVHDILDRLGILCKDSDELSLSTESHTEKNKEPTLTKAHTFSTASIPSPSNSAFNSTFFDESLASMESGIYEESPVDQRYFSELNPIALDTDMGLAIPFEVYSSMVAAKNTADYEQFSPQLQDMDAQDWCPLSMLNSVMNGDFPVDQSWGSNIQPLF